MISAFLWLAVLAAVIVIPSLSYDRERDRQIAADRERRDLAYRKKWGAKSHGA